MRLLFQYVQHTLLPLTSTIHLCQVHSFVTYLHCQEMQDSAHFIGCLTDFSPSYFVCHSFPLISKEESKGMLRQLTQ